MYFPVRRSLPARPEPDNTFWTDSALCLAPQDDGKFNARERNCKLCILEFRMRRGALLHVTTPPTKLCQSPRLSPLHEPTALRRWRWLRRLRRPLPLLTISSTPVPPSSPPARPDRTGLNPSVVRAVGTDRAQTCANKNVSTTPMSNVCRTASPKHLLCAISDR